MGVKKDSEVKFITAMLLRDYNYFCNNFNIFNNFSIVFKIIVCIYLLRRNSKLKGKTIFVERKKANGFYMRKTRVNKIVDIMANEEF